MSVYSGSEEEEICMECYAVPAVEGLVEGGEGPQQGSLANSTCYRTSHSKMYTEGVLKTIGIKHFNYRTAEVIIVWLKVR